MQQLKLNLFEAYYNARKNKRNTNNQLRFEINYEQELFKLYDEIKTKTYKIGKSIAFIINKPIKREIFAASFRDRVVHHLIFNYINPILEPQFIKDSYSCRKEKGTLYGIHQVHPNKIYLQPISKGFLFLGAFIKPNRLYISNRTKRKFKYMLTNLFHLLKNSDTLMLKQANNIVSIINSYHGLLSHYNTYRLRHKLIFSTSPCVLYKLGFFDESIKKITTFKNLEIINNQYLLKSCTN